MMESQTGTYWGQGGLEHLKGYYFLCIKTGEGRLEASGNHQAVMLSLPCQCRFSEQIPSGWD